MRLQSPLGVVTPTLDGEVLRVLAQADAWFTAPRLHRVLGKWSVGSVRKTLNRLMTEGTVEALDAGNAVLYRLNLEHLAAGPIVELANMRALFFERLRESLEGLGPEPSYAAVFGSAARGEMEVGSDVDLFVMRPERGADARWDDRVEKVCSQATRWIGNEVRSVVFSWDEAGDRAPREPILQDVADQGVVLVGDRKLFERRVGAR